jgi:hypothetical protein
MPYPDNYNSALAPDGWHDPAEDEAGAFVDELGDALARVRREMHTIPRTWAATDTATLLGALSALADGDAPPWRRNA